MQYTVVIYTVDTVQWSMYVVYRYSTLVFI